MPDFNTWISSSVDAIDPEDRAIRAWSRIQREPTSITIKRLGTPQTVRIEPDDTGQEVSYDQRTIGKQQLVVFGIKDHPTLTDTDIVRGDRFVLGTVMYEVTILILHPGEVQAVSEAKAS